MNTAYYPEKKTPGNATKTLSVNVLREADCTFTKVPRVDKVTGQALLLAFGVLDEPPSVAAYRADVPKPPAADLTGIYARFPTGPSSDDLVAATSAWLKASKPDVPGSKVEKAFHVRGFSSRGRPPTAPSPSPSGPFGARVSSAHPACDFSTATAQPPASNCAWASTGQGQPGGDLGTCQHRRVLGQG